MGRLEISLLGPVLVTRDSDPITGFEYDKVRGLLAYLALEADRPQRREALAGLLWPDQPEKVARDSLRNALATLRKAIGDETADPPYLLVTREAVRFNAESDHTLDSGTFARLLEQAARHRHRNPDTCRVCAGWRREAAELYRGPLLAQFSLPDSPEFESWLVMRREKLHRDAMEAFARLAGFYLRRGEHPSARYYAGRQLVYEAWNEMAHRQAMLALARMGERGAALKQYESCRLALDEELGITPEPETILLYERIRDGGAAPESAPRVAAPPVQPLIGREGDLATLGFQLADPDVRLLTIIGPGGVGKTSLAQAAAHEFGSDFAGGSMFVPLATTPDPAGIYPAIAGALGLLPDPSRTAEAHLSDYLRPLELLLVLDNFEHLTAGGELLVKLLAGAPRLVLLVTSRERLNLSAEWLYELWGLDFPGENTDRPLAKFAAMRLFARRASQGRGDFALLSAEASAAAEICRLVQGMPLAIELAAASTGGRSTAEIALSLRAGLDALAVKWADLPPRHRSIRAAFEHSWSLLTGDERRMLRRLSIFSDGFDVDAAGALAGAGPDDLRRLRDKSLLQARDNGRFDFHPLIHTFAAERLAARNEADAAARRHLAYFTTMAEQGEQALKGREQLTWTHHLEADHANILAALTWAEEHDYFGAARLAAAMWVFWFVRGHLVEGRRHYEWLYTDRDMLPTQLRAGLLNGYCSAIMGQSDLAAIEPVALEALACYREAGDDEGIAFSLHHLAIAARAQGDLEASVRLAHEGIVAGRRLAEAQSPFSLTVVQDTLATTLTLLGRFAEAEILIGEVESLSMTFGDRWGWAYHHFKLGILQLRIGKFDAARMNIEKTLAIGEEFGDRRLILATSIYLSELALRSGEPVTALRLAETAERYSREVGDKSSHTEALLMMGDILAARGFPAEAARRYEEAREEYLIIGNESAAKVAADKLDELQQPAG